MIISSLILHSVFNELPASDLDSSVRPYRWNSVMMQKPKGDILHPLYDLLGNFVAIASCEMSPQINPFIAL
jgi:hypothetical protein